MPKITIKQLQEQLKTSREINEMQRRDILKLDEEKCRVIFSHNQVKEELRKADQLISWMKTLIQHLVVQNAK